MGSVQTMFDRAVGTTKESNFKNYVRTDGGLSYQMGKYNISLLVNNLLDNRKLLTAGSFQRQMLQLLLREEWTTILTL